MVVITNLKNMNTEEVLELMNNIVGDVGSLALEIAKSAVEPKAAGTLASSIKDKNLGGRSQHMTWKLMFDIEI